MATLLKLNLKGSEYNLYKSVYYRNGTKSLKMDCSVKNVLSKVRSYNSIECGNTPYILAEL